MPIPTPLFATETHSSGDATHLTDHALAARALNDLHGVIVDTPGVGATLNPDMAGSVHLVTLPASGTVTIGPATSTASPTYLQGQRALFAFTQPAAGGVGVLWDASWVGAPPVRQSPGAVTIAEFVNSAATGSAPTWSYKLANPLGELTARDGTVQQTSAWDYAAGLRKFYEQVAQVEVRPVDVVIVGDSIDEGYFAYNSTLTWKEQLRLILQGALNPPNVGGGGGYIPAAHGVEPLDHSLTADEIPYFAHPFTLSGGAVAQVKSGSGLPLSYGMGYRYVGLQSGTAQATATLTCDRFWLSFAIGPAFGNVKVVVDGGAAQTISLYSATQQRSGQMFDSGTLTRGSHTITVTADNTLVANPIYNVAFEGVMLFDGDGGVGPASILPSSGAGTFEDKGGVDYWAANTQPGAAKQGLTCTLDGSTYYAGTHSMRMTCDGTQQTPTLVGQPLSVVGGRFYTWLSRINPLTTSRPYQLAYRCYSANADGSLGTLQSTVVASTLTTPAVATWTGFGAAGVQVPVGTAYVVPVVTINYGNTTTPPAGEAHNLDSISFSTAIGTILTGSTIQYNLGQPLINQQFAQGTPSLGGSGIRMWDASHSGYQAGQYAGPGAPNVTPAGFNALASWADAFDYVEPDLVIIPVGTNDASSAGVTAAQYEVNLRAMVAQIRASAASDPSILLVSKWPWPTNSGLGGAGAWADYTAAARRVARSMGCAWLDLGSKIYAGGQTRLPPLADYYTTPSNRWAVSPGGVQGTQGLFSDGGVHPQTLGHRLIAQIVAGFLLAPLSGVPRGMDMDSHLVAGGPIPGTLVSAGGGTGATASVTANMSGAVSSDNAGVFTFTTGTASLAAGQIGAVLFGRGSVRSPRSVVLTPANAAAAGAVANIYAYVNSGGISFNAVAALPASTTYAWNYQVIF